MNIFQTFWKSVRETFDEMFLLFTVNVLWLLMNVPFLLLLLVTLGGGATALSFLVLLASTIAFGPANAGLYAIAQRITEGRASSWRDFVAGVRTYARLSWKVYGLWMLGLVMMLFNVQFYQLNGSTISGIITVFFLYLLVVWLSALIYIGPLMILQTDKRIRTIARNAGLMVLGRPIFTLVTLVLMLLITALSIVLPLLFIVVTAAFLALWGFRATLTLISEAEARRERLATRTAEAPAAKGRSGQVRPRD